MDDGGIMSALWGTSRKLREKTFAPLQALHIERQYIYSNLCLLVLLQAGHSAFGLYNCLRSDESHTGWNILSSH